MTTILSRLAPTALRNTYRVRPRRPIPRAAVAAVVSSAAPFSSIPPVWSSSKSDENNAVFLTSLTAEDRAFYDSLSPEDKIQFQTDAAKIDQGMRSSRVEAAINAAMADALRELSGQLPPDPVPPYERFKGGLMSMGETDEQDIGEDELFGGDDMTALGHGELEKHRELREYARIAAWEMPLLNKLSKPFQPPPLDRPLRFRYTNYMGETHPAAKKVVLEFCTADLPLTPAQRLKLIKLVGVRYNPQTDVVRISAEMFESQAQNKRYLGDLVDTLITEVKNEGTDEGARDPFDDVPVDFRHVKWKKRVEFPETWKMTPERMQQLKVDRQARDTLEAERELKSLSVDGIKLVQEALLRAPAIDPKQVLLEAQKSKKGKAAKMRTSARR